jgi:hypothetical protein
MLSLVRQRRVKVLEALEQRAKQFRAREGLWPFRIPHDALDLEDLIEATLAEEDGWIQPAALRTRSVLRLEWDGGDAWELWVITLPSGIHLYCDSDGEETRVLASAKRGNPLEADGFFLERLAESRGDHFGIGMEGPAPDRIKSAIGDRDFLAEVFVELLEDTAASAPLKTAATTGGAASDFHTDIVRWLDEVLTAPPPGRRQPRVREKEPGAGL